MNSFRLVAGQTWPEKKTAVADLGLCRSGMTRIVNETIKFELIPSVPHLLYKNMSYPRLSNAWL